MRQFILFLFFTSSIVSAQVKKEYFLDENSKHISKGEFYRRVNHEYNLDVVIKNDSIIINKLFQRKITDNLSNEKLTDLRNYLAEISGTAIDKNKTIIINYYSGLDGKEPAGSKSTWNIYYKKYTKTLQKLDNVQQFWVYKYDENLEHHHKDRINWLFDKSGLIEKTFFPYHFNVGSFTIISPNGKYQSYYGEYGYNHVFESLKELNNAK